MSCCGKTRASSTSRAIQQSKFNIKAKRIKNELCINLEKRGNSLTVVINNGNVYLTKPFISAIPAHSALVSMGCAGVTARRLHSICKEILILYKHPGHKQIFETKLEKSTLLLKDLARLIEFVKSIT